MRKVFVFAAAVCLALVLTGCGGRQREVVATITGMDDFRGQDMVLTINTFVDGVLQPAVAGNRGRVIEGVLEVPLMTPPDLEVPWSGRGTFTIVLDHRVGVIQTLYGFERAFDGRSFTVSFDLFDTLRL